MARIAQLPLAAQPGERWLYHTGADILAVLIARIAGVSFDEFLQTRIFKPLAMHDTGFSVPPDKIGRLATCYAFAEDGTLKIWDAPDGPIRAAACLPNACSSRPPTTSSPSAACCSAAVTVCSRPPASAG